MPGLSKREKRVAKRALQPPVVVPKPKKTKRGWKTPQWLLASLHGLNSAIRHPFTSYAAIVLLQLKVVWGMWWYKDLTTGDTSQYFLGATEWFRTGLVSFFWSPLYTVYLGSHMYLSKDSYTIIILHRLIIVFVSTTLVLALMRHLMPPGIAWVAAAWWAVLPINFDALYEVHLFAVIPLLLGVLAVLWVPGATGRGLGAASLIATAVLMRNEYTVAAALFLALSLGWEVFYNTHTRSDFKKIGLAYGLPFLGAGFLILVCFVRSNDATTASTLRGKQTVNVCQVFAAGYQQRSQDFQGNAMSECDQLMNRVFGSADLTFLEAIRRNPKAMAQHVWWNIQLAPSGLQVLLFNLRSGHDNPDYAPTFQSGLALIPTLLACLTLIAGLVLLVRERKFWRAQWTQECVWAWVAMGCTALSVCAAMLSNRPRPSYMFILGIALRALIASCFYVIVRRWPRARRVGAGILSVLVAAVLFVPSFYEYRPSSRPLLSIYRRLQSSPAFAPGSLLVTQQYGVEISAYVGRCSCPSISYSEVRRAMAPDESLAQVLDRKGANLFYVDEPVMSDPIARQFVANADTYHWRVVAGRHTSEEDWAFLRRNP
jgi:hypothetical protein